MSVLLGLPWWLRWQKNLPAMQETRVWSLGQKDALEKGLANHSNIFAWRSPWTEEPGRLQSMVLQRVRHNWATNTFIFQFHNLLSYSFLKKIFIYLAELGLSRVRGIFGCGLGPLSYSMWDLVPWPGIEPRSPALGAWSLSHWTTREVPVFFLFVFF